MNWFQYFSISVILISYLSSLRIFRLDKSPLLKLFSFFLLFLLLGELFGMAWSKWIWSKTGFTRSNQWFYNFFHAGTYSFYLYFFYKVLSVRYLKRWVQVMGAVYLMFVIYNLSFWQGVYQFNSYTELFSCFIMIFLSIAYYYQLLHAKEIIVLSRDPFFWISTGVLTYHLGSMMGLFLINVMNAISLDKARDIHLIIGFCGILMYLNFTVAFLCLKKK